MTDLELQLHDTQNGTVDNSQNPRCVYFMEDKFGPRGNLIPRDVVAREMYLTVKQIYLDISSLRSNGRPVERSNGRI